MVVHTLHPSILEASLVKASSRPARAIPQDPVSTNKKQNKQQIPDYHLSTVNVSFYLFIFLLFPLSTSSTLKPMVKSRPWWQVLIEKHILYPGL